MIYFKLDICLKKVSRDAGVRLCNLKRRAGFDANILPAKKPALSDANRQAKVNNIEIVSMLITNHKSQIVLMNLGLSFCCLAWSNRFQVRDQEDAEQREARLADKRHHQALVRFVYCLQPSFGQTI